MKKNLIEAKTSVIFCYFKHEIQLLKVLLSLKVVKFDTKMHLNFSNFRGGTSAGGTSLGPKTWTSVRWGIGKIFADGGTTPVPPGKKTLQNYQVLLFLNKENHLFQKPTGFSYF